MTSENWARTPACPPPRWCLLRCSRPRRARRGRRCAEQVRLKTILEDSSSCSFSAQPHLTDTIHTAPTPLPNLPHLASEPNLKVKHKLKKHLYTRKSPLTRKESAPPTVKHRVPDALGKCARLLLFHSTQLKCEMCFNASRHLPPSSVSRLVSQQQQHSSVRLQLAQ